MTQLLSACSRDRLEDSKMSNYGTSLRPSCFQLAKEKVEMKKAKVRCESENSASKAAERENAWRLEQNNRWPLPHQTRVVSWNERSSMSNRFRLLPSIWLISIFCTFSSGLNSNTFWEFLAIFFFCCAVSPCVYDHNHPYLVSEPLFFAENKAFPYQRRVGAILWDDAATWPVVIFVAVVPKLRSPKLSVSWLTPYGLVDRLPVSTGNFERALQRHFLVDFQSQAALWKFADPSISRLIED